MADESVVRKSEDDGVELLIVKHPPVNALSQAVMAGLEREVAALQADPNARCAIVTGDGQYFSAGADLKEMATVGFAQAPEVVARGHRIFSQLETLRVPVIAAINGLALGGGLELALACDLRVAGDSAKLGAPEVNYGLMPAYGGTQRLPRIVGLAKAREMIFTGNLVSAAEALRIGLVNKVVPSGQELRAARDLAHTIGERAPKAVQAAKRALREGFPPATAGGLKAETELFLREVLPTQDLAEGLLAFAERRPPKFKGA